MRGAEGRMNQKGSFTEQDEQHQEHRVQYERESEEQRAGGAESGAKGVQDVWE